MQRTVKVSAEGGQPSPNMSQFTGNQENTVGNYRFFFNDEIESADFWFIMEGSNAGDDHCNVPFGGFSYLTAETSYPFDWFERSNVRLDYLRQFDQVFTNYYVPLANVEYAFPFLPWMINANHGPSISEQHERDLNFLLEDREIFKNDRISMICSNQQWTPSHRLRFQFAQQIKEHFGDRLDWFGNGVRPIPEKWLGLSPYPYTMVLENQVQSGVVTEKLIDAFLAQAFPFYWGAPNAQDVFPAESFVRIDALNLSSSIEIIEREIAVPYQARVEALQKAKSVALVEFHYLNRIAAICEDLESRGDWNPNRRRDVHLVRPTKSEARFGAGFQNPRRLAGSVIEGIGRRISRGTHKI